MVASRQFVESLDADGLLAKTARIHSEMYGSLGTTGRGHGSTKAVLLGLEGETPREMDIAQIPERLAQIRDGKRLMLLGKHKIAYNEKTDLTLHKRKSLPYHPNGMIFHAYDTAGEELAARAYYSIGGGFVINETNIDNPVVQTAAAPVPYPFDSGQELLALCQQTGKTISEMMLANEKALQSEDDIRRELLAIWEAMKACVTRGCEVEGVLPGGLEVKRRAPALYRQLASRQPDRANLTDPLAILDWVNIYAIAVNEENAAGGRVVTAPTNGAAGVVPAVLHYYYFHMAGADEDGVIRFLLTAAAIGSLFKKNASISGAEVGCQGEIGSACSMAAAGLAEVSGATPAQIENAAEIAMEHNLGLTCDPIGGLVQIPCIERNAVGANKAINAVRLAMAGDGTHFVSLDKVIKTMKATGMDMKDKYKETARGGLATNVVEVPINVVDC